MANRLSADPSVEVVVLEAGPRDKDQVHPHPGRLLQAVPRHALVLPDGAAEGAREI